MTTTKAILTETAPNYNKPCMSFSQQMDLHCFLDSLGFHIAESRKNNPNFSKELCEVYEQFERLFNYYAEYVKQNKSFTARDKDILIACMKQAISELHQHDPKLRDQPSEFLIERAKENSLHELIPVLEGKELSLREKKAISETVLQGLPEDPLLLDYNVRYQFVPSTIAIILTACALGAFSVIGFWALSPLVIIPLAIWLAPRIQKRFGTSLKEVANDFNDACDRNNTHTPGNNEQDDSHDDEQSLIGGESKPLNEDEINNNQYGISQVTIN